MALLNTTVPLASVDLTAIDAIFVVGGHLATPEVGSIPSRAWQGNKVLAAVCHGPAALVHAVDAAGKPVVANRKAVAEARLQALSGQRQ